MAIKNGSVHKSSAIDTNERSLTVSDTSVMANMVNTPTIVDGMVSRFVVNVLNPRFRNDNVRYVPGGEEGMPNIKPMMYSGHKS